MAKGELAYSLNNDLKKILNPDGSSHDEKLIERKNKLIEENKQLTERNEELNGIIENLKTRTQFSFLPT